MGKGVVVLVPLLFMYVGGKKQWTFNRVVNFNLVVLIEFLQSWHQIKSLVFLMFRHSSDATLMFL